MSHTITNTLRLTTFNTETDPYPASYLIKLIRLTHLLQLVIIQISFSPTGVKRNLPEFVETVNNLAFRNGEPASHFNGTNPKSPRSSQHRLKRKKKQRKKKRKKERKSSKISTYSEKGNGKKRKVKKNQTTCCEQ